MPVDPVVRPVVLGAVTDDVHAGHVVTTVERLAQHHDLRPVFVHVSGHHVVDPIVWSVGAPYQEPVPCDLDAVQAEDAFAAWRAAKSVFARAGVDEGRDAYIVGGDPAAVEIRHLARRLRAATVVLGRGLRRSRLRGLLAGSTAFALARSCPAATLFVDDGPAPSAEGPIVCMLLGEHDGWAGPLRSAAAVAGREGRQLEVFAPDPPPVVTSPVPAIRPEHVPLDGRPAVSIAELAERRDAGLVVLGDAGTTTLRALLRGSTSIELLARSRRPLLLCRATDQPSIGC